MIFISSCLPLNMVFHLPHPKTEQDQSECSISSLITVT